MLRLISFMIILIFSTFIFYSCTQNKALYPPNIEKKSSCIEYNDAVKIMANKINNRSEFFNNNKYLLFNTGANNNQERKLSSVFIEDMLYHLKNIKIIRNSYPITKKQNENNILRELDCDEILGKKQSNIFFEFFIKKENEQSECININIIAKTYNTDGSKNITLFQEQISFKLNSELSNLYKSYNNLKLQYKPRSDDSPFIDISKAVSQVFGKLLCFQKNNFTYTHQPLIVLGKTRDVPVELAEIFIDLILDNNFEQITLNQKIIVFPLNSIESFNASLFSLNYYDILSDADIILGIDYTFDNKTDNYVLKASLLPIENNIFSENGVITSEYIPAQYDTIAYIDKKAITSISSNPKKDYEIQIIKEDKAESEQKNSMKDGNYSDDTIFDDYISDNIESSFSDQFSVVYLAKEKVLREKIIEEDRTFSNLFDVKELNNNQYLVYWILNQPEDHFVYVLYVNKNNDSNKSNWTYELFIYHKYNSSYYRSKILGNVFKIKKPKTKLIHYKENLENIDYPKTDIVIPIFPKNKNQQTKALVFISEHNIWDEYVFNDPNIVAIRLIKLYDPTKTMLCFITKKGLYILDVVFNTKNNNLDFPFVYQNTGNFFISSENSQESCLFEQISDQLYTIYVDQLNIDISFAKKTGKPNVKIFKFNMDKNLIKSPTSISFDGLIGTFVSYGSKTINNKTSCNINTIQYDDVKGVQRTLLTNKPICFNLPYQNSDEKHIRSFVYRPSSQSLFFNIYTIYQLDENHGNQYRLLIKSYDYNNKTNQYFKQYDDNIYDLGLISLSDVKFYGNYLMYPVFNIELEENNMRVIQFDYFNSK